ncbi:MAG: enoyl-CoA hydratase [Pseudomonadota bacterium]|nr:enoyl-CoA hydratase [Pseudomonadota bacterium]
MASNTAAATNQPILLREDSGGVCTLTLNRPAEFNALSEAMLGCLQDSFDAIAEDPSVRVVVLAARGKAFCAGHDLKEMRARPDQDYYTNLFKKCGRMMVTMTHLPQPVIARVQGVATAAGCQLVANSDLAVAANDVTLGVSGINVGLFCMTPGVALSRNIGRKQAFEMLFTGEIADAGKALEIGLINRAAAPDELDYVVGQLAQSIVAKSRAAVTAGKRVFYNQLTMDLQAAYDYTAVEMACNMMFHDAGEGIDAFIAKRPPVWRDE